MLDKIKNINDTKVVAPEGNYLMGKGPILILKNQSLDAFEIASTLLITLL